MSFHCCTRDTIFIVPSAKFTDILVRAIVNYKGNARYTYYFLHLILKATIMYSTKENYSVHSIFRVKLRLRVLLRELIAVKVFK